jgi:hypothetical protein
MAKRRRDASLKVPWSIVKLDEALVDPVATVMTSPNPTPHKPARNGSPRNSNGPDVPKFGERRLGGVPIIERF